MAKLSEMRELSKVYLVDPQTGSDSTRLCGTRKAALVCAAAIIIDALVEGTVMSSPTEKDERDELIGMLREGDYESARDFYNEGMNPDTLLLLQPIDDNTIHHTECLTAAYDEKVSNLAAGIVMEQDDEEDNDLDDDDDEEDEDEEEEEEEEDDDELDEDWDDPSDLEDEEDSSDLDNSDLEDDDDEEEEDEEEDSSDAEVTAFAESFPPVGFLAATN